MEWISLKNYLPMPNESVLWYDAMFDQVSYFGLKYPLTHDGDYTHFMRVEGHAIGLNTIERPKEYQETNKDTPLKIYFPAVRYS